MDENDTSKQLLEANAKIVHQNSQLLEANTKIASLEANIKELNKQLREQKVEGAIRAGELLANKRDFALSLEDNAQLEKFLEVSKGDTTLLQSPTQYEQNGKEANSIESTPEYKAIASQLGL